ncbi:hypothetical protein K402DRAFT_386373 [Aulographum hederae CBS 113979]|uniref:Uncharacterized protein n=1 Tax=Aulographum hederae CBS 113979 TaxID=1176131 RepID=A0A6G1GKR9_9PEZI|nr:hypothetical protein K402DRAFT_386373 [Aulographum hederae CBS 113979]
MSGTEFISHLEPPGRDLQTYNPSKPPTQQPASVPKLFIDAMMVRKAVYVDEQGVPLANEVDADDARSHHWVVYASVGTRKKSASEGSPNQSPPGGISASPNPVSSASTATRVAVGTVRLVPPPHSPHPTPGSSNHTEPPGSRPTGPPPGSAPKEPYIKLGRLATLPAYRGLHLSNILVRTCLEWATTHATTILPPPSAAEREEARMQGREIADVWKGLVLVHAQDTVEGLWKRHGFVKDEAMGEWWEEDIKHLGMWRRLDVKEK